MKKPYFPPCKESNTYLEESMDDTITKWVNGQFWNAKEVLPREWAIVSLVQACEAAVKSFNLARQNWVDETTIFRESNNNTSAMWGESIYNTMHENEVDILISNYDQLQSSSTYNITRKSAMVHKITRIIKYFIPLHKIWIKPDNHFITHSTNLAKTRQKQQSIDILASSIYIKILPYNIYLISYL